MYSGNLAKLIIKCNHWTIFTIRSLFILLQMFSLLGRSFPSSRVIIYIDLNLLQCKQIHNHNALSLIMSVSDLFCFHRTIPKPWGCSSGSPCGKRTTVLLMTLTSVRSIWPLCRDLENYMKVDWSRRNFSTLLNKLWCLLSQSDISYLPFIFSLV